MIGWSRLASLLPLVCRATFKKAPRKGDFMAGNKNIAATVREGILPTADALGYTLWDVEFLKEGARRILRVTIDHENGITIDDILVHDAHCEDNTVQLKLAMMEGPDFPIALGVIRDVEAPTYDEAVAEQIEEVKAKKPYHTFEELLLTNDTWEVK